MQTVSSGWNNSVTKAARTIGFGVLLSWLRTTSSGVKFFTINQSKIGGADILKSGGTAVAFFDKYAYTDYSRYATSLSVSRKLGQYPFGTLMAQADVELDNTSRLFLPGYDQTIGSGILPNRPLKLSIGLDGEMMQQFTGFIGMPENTLGNRVTTLHGFDVFNFINSYVSTTSGSLVGKYFHEIVAQILNEMGFSASQYVLDKSLQPPIGYVAPYASKAGDIFRDGASAEQGLVFADENGIIRFWNRQHFTTLSGAVSFRHSYSTAQDMRFQNTPVINDVQVTAKPRSVKSVQKIWDLTLSVLVPPGGTADYFVNFTDEYGDMPVTSVNLPVYFTSATSSSFATSSSSDGTGTIYPTAVTVTGAYLFGNTYRITFANSSAYNQYVTNMSLYGTPARITTVIDTRYQDQTSIDTYGRNPSNNGEVVLINNDYIQNLDTAKSLAYTLVKEYKDPRKRYVIPVAVNGDPSLQIGDFGQVTIQDTGETKNVYITGITNMLDRDANYQQILEVEERQIKKYFTINQSKIGSTDTIAP